MLSHDVHRMRRILGRLLCGWCIEFGDAGRYDLGLPFLKRDRRDENTWNEGTRTYSLQFSQDVFTDTVLVKVSFNRGNHFIYDGAINGGLIDKE